MDLHGCNPSDHGIAITTVAQVYRRHRSEYSHIDVDHCEDLYLCSTWIDRDLAITRAYWLDDKVQ